MFITAEIGTHWKGDLVLLEEIVQKCKDVGFDAVKFQSFLPEDLNSRPYRIAASVTKDNVQQIDSICKKIGIEWYCMPTYVEAVDFLDPYVSRYKIRYRDSDNISLLSKVLSRDKPVIISSPNPRKLKSEQITYLYCINQYPHTVDDVDYKAMMDYDGFSCHCPTIECVSKAVWSGIRYLEVHVTQDPTDETLADNKVAFPLYDCKIMIGWVRDIQHQLFAKRQEQALKDNPKNV